MVGEGAYGVVIKIEKEKVIKINVIDSSFFGIGTLREADMLARLKSHPHLVELVGMFLGTPDVSKVRSRILRSSKYKVDSLHFILKYEEDNLENILEGASKKRKAISLSWKTQKLIFCQLLLSLEWMHAKGIVHRDVKPANILISGLPARPQVRLCDFGLSGVLSPPAPLDTPGTVTSWYRAPEICFNASYAEKVDLWSLGAVMFEVVARRALFQCPTDHNYDILSTVANKIPCLIDKQTVKKMAPFFEMSSLRHLTPEFERWYEMGKPSEAGDVSKRLRTLLSLTASEVQEFHEETGQSLKTFCDLLASLLAFNPDGRFSATEALNHTFFDDLRPLISSTRSSHPPVPPPAFKTYAFVSGEKRQTVFHLVYSLYNSSLQIPWYSHKLLFHAISLFDRFLIHESRFSKAELSCSKFESRSQESNNRDETYLKFYVCLYMFHKFFRTLELPLSWDSFVPNCFTDKNSKFLALRFEIELLKDVCNYTLYHESLHEWLVRRDGRARETVVRTCLIKLGDLNKRESGTVETVGWEELV